MRLPGYQELSKEQDAINNLTLDGSYLITGPPGTGKTVMAIYRAKMLSMKGGSTKLLMFSRLLSQYTRSAVAELGAESSVSTYHSWLESFYRRTYAKRPPTTAPYVHDWGAILNEVADRPPPPAGMEHLIIDEGQDLPPMFYPTARYLSTHLTVFADENQRLNDSNSTIEEIKAGTGITDIHELRRNYRNTREIAELASTFYTGLPTGIPDLPERRGERPRIVSTDRLHETVEFIARYENSRTDEEIGVFVPTRKLQTKLCNRLEGKTANPVQAYVGGEDGAGMPEVTFDGPGIKVICHQSAKGLEFDTVFLPELQSLHDDPDGASFKMRLYVLTSRARERLFLMYSGDDKPAVLTGIDPSLVEET